MFFNDRYNFNGFRVRHVKLEVQVEFIAVCKNGGEIIKLFENYVFQ